MRYPCLIKNNSPAHAGRYVYRLLVPARVLNGRTISSACAARGLQQAATDNSGGLIQSFKRPYQTLPCH